MTKQEQQDLKLIVYRLDEQDKRVESFYKEFKNDLQELHTDIKFIKENLFNPETALMGRNKTKYANIEKTRLSNGGIIGGGVIALM